MAHDPLATAGPGRDAAELAVLVYLLADYVRSLRVQHASALVALYGRQPRHVHWLLVLDLHGRWLWQADQLRAAGLAGTVCPLLGAK